MTKPTHGLARTENSYLSSLAAVRLLAYAIRKALSNHQRRKREQKEFPSGHIAVVATAVHEIQV